MRRPDGPRERQQWKDHSRGRPSTKSPPPGNGPSLTLMYRGQFVDLLAEYYEKLEPEYQAMVPLKKVYVPVKVK